MLKSVVVAYDGSDLSREAFAYGTMLARAANASMVVVRVIEPLPSVTVLPDPAIAVAPIVDDVAEDPARIEAERETAVRELSEQVGFARTAGVECSARIEESGLIDALRRVADPTDLIAIGMKGRFARARIGSSTAELVRHSPCPVLVVSGALRDVNRVLCAFDGSGPSARAVEWSRALAEQSGWPLSVLAVERPGATLEQALEGAQRLAPEAQVISYGDHGQSEARQIESAAEQTRTALLVMGAFPDSWLHRLFFGGTTDHVLTHVNAPVVLIP
ncbi:MAG: universal stress protein [Phycisphaeraceae bacterium]|nr:universal stress protein [Phycisphaeraceae bacterium]